MNNTRIALLALTLGGTTLVACDGRSGGILTAERRECPHDWAIFDLAAARDGTGPATPLTFPVMTSPSTIARMTQNIPEFNDCQRFIHRDGGSRKLVYDSLHAIFASDRLQDLVKTLDNLNTDPARDSFAVAAAEVWSDSAYGPLGIGTGHSCLYMWRQAIGDAATTQWRARMLRESQIGAALENCLGALKADDAMQGTELQVMPPVTFPGLSDEDIPAVARWDYDAKTEQQYVGIRCGAAWCEIGPPGFAVSPGLRDPGGSADQRRVQLVKGWYDHQLLAAELGDNGQLEPTDIDGIIMPAGQLDSRDDWKYYRDTFDATATVMLRSTTGAPTTPGLDKYIEHYGLPAGTTLPVEIQLALCYGSAASCGVAVATTSCAAEGTADDYDVPNAPKSDSRMRWYSRATSAGSTKDFCITRYPGHMKGAVPFDIPGAVTWRWKANDEGGWMRCIWGCCELL